VISNSTVVQATNALASSSFNYSSGQIVTCTGPARKSWFITSLTKRPCVGWKKVMAFWTLQPFLLWHGLCSTSCPQRASTSSPQFGPPNRGVCCLATRCLGGHLKDSTIHPSSRRCDLGLVTWLSNRRELLLQVLVFPPVTLLEIKVVVFIKIVFSLLSMFGRQISDISDAASSAERKVYQMQHSGPASSLTSQCAAASRLFRTLGLDALASTDCCSTSPPNASSLHIECASSTIVSISISDIAGCKSVTFPSTSGLDYLQTLKITGCNLMNAQLNWMALGKNVPLLKSL
jgi:hypothetical protein